jgi:RNA recognition motif-containing protein
MHSHSYRGGRFIKNKESKMNIYVGNLSHDATPEDLQQAFEAFGQVTSVNIIKDKFSGESRGFGFVEMPETNEAEAAIEGLNGTSLKGRNLSVNQARPRPDNRRSGGGGRPGGGSGGGRFGGGRSSSGGGGRSSGGSSGGGRGGHRSF